MLASINHWGLEDPNTLITFAFAVTHFPLLSCQILQLSSPLCVSVLVLYPFGILAEITMKSRESNLWAAWTLRLVVD